MNKPKYILIHTTDVSVKTLYDQFKSVNTYHRDVRDFPISSLGYFVGYHRLITGGKNYKCREDSDVGAHCNQVVDGLSMNFQSCGVCVGFDGDIEPVPTWAYPLLQKQVWDWQDKYKIPNERVKFHRDYATGKTCPGSLITKAWLANLLARPITQPKPDDQKDKQIDILLQQVSLLQRLLDALKRLINGQY